MSLAFYSRVCNFVWLFFLRRADAGNPSLGVLMTISGGDRCPNNVSRELQVSLRCANTFSAQPGDHVTEDSVCQYQLAFDTVFACPLECGSANRKLCAGHGLCQYDTDVRVSKCFCDKGWSGSDCSVGACACLHLCVPSRGYFVFGMLLGCFYSVSSIAHVFCLYIWTCMF